jgi:hypothetical protein
MKYDVQQHKKTQKHLLLTHDDLEYTVPQSTTHPVMYGIKPILLSLTHFMTFVISESSCLTGVIAVSGVTSFATCIFCRQAGLERELNNHSIRATSITVLDVFIDCFCCNL